MEQLHMKIQEEYRPMISDILKFAIILVVLNMIVYFYNPKENSCLGGAYIKLMVGILLGVATYWLIVDRLIAFD
jgi:hypothetical protein